MTDKIALIGLDGFSREDRQFLDDEWHDLEIETVAHTCPSWNAVFLGYELHEVYGFWKTPNEYEPNTSVSSNTDEKWTYDDMPVSDYIWNDVDVEVVSAPVALPTFTTLDSGISPELSWPAKLEEITRSINALTEETLNHDRVITVFPEPDKCNHLRDNPDKDYGDADRFDHMIQLADAVDRLRGHFDRYMLISDHGQPSPREYVTDDLWVASHDPTGQIASNAVDVNGLTNTSAYPKIKELFEP